MANEASRPRTILWAKSVDKIAADLAHEKRFKRGVSEFLERLVIAESRRKRGISHLHEPILKRAEGSA